ncbi:hypothetical protein N2152v2_003592 [Parachlorella kessleri]
MHRPPLSRPLGPLPAPRHRQRAQQPRAQAGAFQAGDDSPNKPDPEPSLAAASAPPTPSGAPRSMQEAGPYPKDFLFRRWLTFAGIIVGYSCFYLTRNSLTYTAPAMVADPTLGIGISEVGTMTSIFPIAYGSSKFISGVLGSRTSPSVLLAGGLMATALCNVAFGFSSALTWYCTWWALNGTLQVREGGGRRQRVYGNW